MVKEENRCNLILSIKSESKRENHQKGIESQVCKGQK